MLCFSSFQRNPQDATKSQDGPRADHGSRPLVANPDVVSSGAGNGDSDAQNPPQERSNSSPGPATPAPTGSKVPPAGCHAVIRNTYRAAGFSEDIIAILAKSWRNGTHSQFRTYLERWVQFCGEREIDAVNPSINDVLNFLYLQYANGLGYSAMNTARSALSTIITIDNMPIGQHPLVSRFLKGFFNDRPALPRYCVTWDVCTVLNYLKGLSPVSTIPIKSLIHKLVMLMLLLSGQRGQTIHLLDTSNMTLSQGYAKFAIGDALKTTRPGHHLDELHFRAYAPDRRLCVHTALKAYLEQTLDNRGKETKLFISLKKPHKAITLDTMKDAGINLAIFAPHSTRAASASKAARSKLPLATILRAAGWYRETTFSKYYQKPIQENFGSHILDHA